MAEVRGTGRTINFKIQYLLHGLWKFRFLSPYFTVKTDFTCFVKSIAHVATG